MAIRMWMMGVEAPDYEDAVHDDAVHDDEEGRRLYTAPLGVTQNDIPALYLALASSSS